MIAESPYAAGVRTRLQEVVTDNWLDAAAVEFAHSILQVGNIDLLSREQNNQLCKILFRQQNRRRHELTGSQSG
jgi:hypothetical protein